MKILIILLIWSVVPVIHKYLLKWLPYRWLINSIIYPWHKRRLKRQLLISSHSKIIDMWFDFDDKWFSKYWFGMRLKSLINDKLLENVDKGEIVFDV